MTTPRWFLVALAAALETACVQIQPIPPGDAAPATDAAADATPATDASGDAPRVRHCGPPITATVFHPTGWAADWSHVLNTVAFNKPDIDGLYRIFLINPDGTNERRFGAGNPQYPQRTTGSPSWHPSGRYLAFVAEKPSHAGASNQATPGWGGYSDIWLATSDGARVWQLTDVPNDADHGVLIPVFSADGTQIEWAEKTATANVLVPAQAAGFWQLRIADFVDDPVAGPHLANERNVGPNGAAFNESGGFSPDGRALLMTTSALTHNFWDSQIASVDLTSGAITPLTPAGYNEHPRFTPDGRVMWMTTTGADLGGVDWWRMNADGSAPERLSYFSSSGHAESNGHAVWPGAVPVENWSEDGSWFLGDVETSLASAAGEIRRIQLTCDAP